MSETDPEAIKAEIEATRDQLGRTIDELSHRLDVPAQARERALKVRETAVETYRERPPVVLGAALALAGLVGAVIIWRRKRTSTRRTR